MNIPYLEHMGYIIRMNIHIQGGAPVDSQVGEHNSNFSMVYDTLIKLYI